MLHLPYKPDKPDQVVRAYDRVFNSEDGRMVLNHLLGQVCGMQRDPMTPDEKTTYANIGKQKVAHEILKILTPNKENNNDRNNNGLNPHA